MRSIGVITAGPVTHVNAPNSSAIDHGTPAIQCAAPASINSASTAP